MWENCYIIECSITYFPIYIILSFLYVFRDVTSAVTSSKEPIEQLIIAELHYSDVPPLLRIPPYHCSLSFLISSTSNLRLPGAIKFPGVLTPHEVAWFAPGQGHRIQVWVWWSSPLLFLPAHIWDLLTCTLTLGHLKIASILEKRH